MVPEIFVFSLTLSGICHSKKMVILEVTGTEGLFILQVTVKKKQV